VKAAMTMGARAMDDVTKRLYATTDASVWAAEWCRIAREIEASDDDRQVIDEGWMIGWFANAFTVAEDQAYERGHKDGLAEATALLVDGGDDTDG